MSNPINKKDIIEGNPFAEISKDIAQAVKQLTEFDTSLKKVSIDLAEIAKNSTATVSGINAINQAEKQSKRIVDEKVANDRLLAKIKKERQSAEQALQRQRERGMAQMAREAKATAEAERPYNKLRAELKKLEKQYLDLSVQGRETTKEGRKLKEQIDTLRSSSDKANKSIGRFNDNVGNYPNTFKGAISALGQLGVVFSGIALGGSIVSVIKENEDAVAGFRTIVSDLNDTEFSKYQNEINNVASNTKRSTIDIAKSFETIAGLNAEFASTSEGIGAVSEAVSTLSKASRGELQPTAENLVGIMNQFDLSADQANRTINVLAAGQAVGASSIAQSAEAYKNFGSVAKGANIDLEKSQALIQVLGKFSIFGAEAGTKLRGVTLQLQKANLGYASGQFDINDALEEFNKKMASKTSQQDKDALSLKVFGAENITAGKIIASNIPLIEKFTKGVTGTDEAQKAAAINSNTLSNRWQELKDSMTNIITTNTGVNGSMSVLKDTLGLVANNLPTIIASIAKLTVGFVAFRTVQALVNTDFKALLSNFTKLKTDATDATGKMSGFGNALKGIGWSVAIGFAIDLGMKLYDIASGAEDATKRMERFNKALQDGQKYGQQLTSSIDKRFQTEQKQLELKLSSGKITQKQYEQEVELLRKGQQARIKFEIESENEQKRRAKENMQQLQSLYERAMSINPLIRTKEMERIIQMYEAQKAEITESNSVLKELYKTNESLKNSEIDLTIEKNKSTTATAKNTKAVKENKKERKDATDQINTLVESMKALDEFMSDAQIDENSKRFEQAMATQLQSINESGEYSIDLITKLIEQEDEYRKAVIERQYAQEMANAKNIADEELALAKRNKALQDLEQDLVTKRKDAYKELETAQEDYANKAKEISDQEAEDLKKANEQKIEDQKKLADEINKIQEGISKALQEQIDRRIEISKREEDAAKSRQSFFESLAENGNITAKESISEQIEIQREAQEEQARLERRKQQIEMISAGLATFNSAIAGGKSPASALAETVLSTSVLVGILKNLNFFAKGTDNAPEGLAVVDEKGAELITDKYGNIKEIGQNKGARFTMLNKGDKVFTATETAQKFDQMRVPKQKIDTAGNSGDLMRINETLKRIEAQNKNNSMHVDWGGISAGVATVIERKQFGRSRTTNIFKG